MANSCPSIRTHIISSGWPEKWLEPDFPKRQHNGMEIWIWGWKAIYTSVNWEEGCTFKSKIQSIQSSTLLLKIPGCSTLTTCPQSGTTTRWALSWREATYSTEGRNMWSSCPITYRVGIPMSTVLYSLSNGLTFDASLNQRLNSFWYRFFYN